MALADPEGVPVLHSANFHYSLPYAPSSDYERGQVVHSPSVLVGGCPFRLRIYPRGRRAASTKATLSTYLEVLERDEWVDDWKFPQVQWTIQVENFDSRHAKSQAGTYDFAADTGCPCVLHLRECGGYEALKQQGWILPDDTVRFNVKVSGSSLGAIKRKREDPDTNAHMWKAMKFTDMCLSGDEQGEGLPCHRAILATFSPVFDRMLSSDMKEGTEQRLILRNASVSTLRSLLEYVYTKKLPEAAASDLKSLQELIQLADQYDMQELFAVCANRIKRIESPDNICEVVKLLGAFPDHPKAKAVLERAKMSVKTSDALFDGLWRALSQADR